MWQRESSVIPNGWRRLVTGEHVMRGDRVWVEHAQCWDPWNIDATPVYREEYAVIIRSRAGIMPPPEALRIEWATHGVIAEDSDMLPATKYREAPLHEDFGG